jgi:succinate-semialdehyde dehydrogenase/glutarate-semialdehyde dehydrogenase
MAGNVCLLKHAANVPQCALAIEEIFWETGFGEGAFQTLLIEAEQTAAVIDDSRVKAVTLTGSDRAGAEVASRAARQIKKTVLELGGSDPFIVMPTADFDAAVSTAVQARMINNGQSCIAAKRFIVHKQIYDRFVEEFVRRVKSVRVGDPLDENTELGPLATSSIRDELDQQVQQSVKSGARVVTGGKKIAGDGYFYEPTVLVDIPPSAPAASDELFGPVASVFKATDIEDAIRIANSTTFGLGASAWTRERDEQSRFIAEIQSGLVFINGMVASDPRLPFGGVKNSGFGRELGEFGIREFVNIKSVRVMAPQAKKKAATE